MFGKKKTDDVLDQLVARLAEVTAASHGPSTGRFYRLPNGIGIVDLAKVVAVIEQDGDVDIRIEGRSYKIRQGDNAPAFAKEVADAVEAFAAGRREEE